MARTKRARIFIAMYTALAAGVTVLFSIIGCEQKQQASPPPPAPTVKVSEVKQETIPVYLDAVGSTSAVKSVDIRARVEGFLTKRNYVEGCDVKEGDLLYVIDPKPYKAQLDNIRGQLAKDQASLANARMEADRYRPLAEQDYVSRETYENYLTQAAEAAATVEADRAAVEKAELDLGYCTMNAPLSGRIGKTMVNVGNLVGMNEDTLLATIVQIDPIYIYFSPSERVLPLLQKKMKEGELSVSVILSDGSEHAHKGKVDFINNVVDSTTGTITLRAVVPNPEKVLLPGQYTQVRLLVDMKSDALLVPEQAIGENQTGSYTLVVGKDNKVEDRDVKALWTYEGMRVIEDGVKAGERVIIEGLQKVRPGMTVRPELAESKEGTTKASEDHQAHQGTAG